MAEVHSYSQILKLFLVLCVFFLVKSQENKYENEQEAKRYLEELGQIKADLGRRLSEAVWNYSTNITEWNKEVMKNATKEKLSRDLELWNETIKYKFDTFKDPIVKRQFVKYSDLGSAVLGPKALRVSEGVKCNCIRTNFQLTEIMMEMSTIYSTATVNIGNKKHLSLEPELTNIMAKERDYNVLKNAWTQWRDATGKKMRHLYPEYVELCNEMARKNSIGSRKFNNCADYWLEDYEDPKLKQGVEKLWKQIEPFYNELHTYVREKLVQKYGDLMPNDGTIPAHLLGNMWAQGWSNIMDLVSPFPNATAVDVTQALKEQGYDQKRMYDLADRFFVGLGMDKMTDEFWNKSMIKKPKDRKVVCHASAWNMGTKTDFRIKACTEITMKDLITIHHEMGHIQYYMLYRDQPYAFRRGANPGFHEAVGDVIALSVSTPKHLQGIGLLKEGVVTEETTLNHQMKMALDKLAFLPYAYILDQWRWKVFSGEIAPADYNKKWWELRRKYQKVSPPVERTEDDFDPGAKYHVTSGTPYIRYFVAHVLEFQIHKALCTIANMTVLHKCDIQNSKEAGQKLRDVLKQGSSVPPQQQLQQLTNMDISAEALLEYFQPLRNYLRSQLKRNTK